MNHTSARLHSRIARTRFALKTLAASVLLGLSTQAALAVDVNFGVIRGLTTSNLAYDNGSLQKHLDELGDQLKWRGPYSETPWDALNAGQVDITFTTVTNAAAVALGNSRFRIFAYQAPDLDGEGVWVKNDSGIRTLADLKGHKIATDRGGSGNHVLLKTLDKAGLPASSVEISYFDPAEALAAFNAGQVDALATWRTFGASAEARGNGVRLVSGRDVNSENVLIYIARDDFAKAHPEVLKAVYDALRESAAQSAADPESTAKVWARLGKLPLEQARIFVPPASREVHLATSALTPTLNDAANLFVKYKVIPRAPALGGLVDDLSQAKVKP